MSIGLHAKMILAWLSARFGRHRRGVVLALTSFFYLFFIPYFDHYPLAEANLGNPNENARVYSVRALAKHGHAHLDRVYQEWPERFADLAERARKESDGPDAPEVLHFSVKSPGLSLFVAPLYGAYTRVREALGGSPVTKRESVYFCRLVGVLLPSIALAYFFYGCLGQLSRNPYLVHATYFVYLLGTITYPYALLFASHNVASGAVFVAFVLLMRPGAASWRKGVRYTFAGFAVGFAVSAEYSAALAGLVVGVYGLVRGTDDAFRAGFAGWWWRRRHLAWALAGAFIPIGATMVYHQIAFGGPFTTGYTRMVEDAWREAYAQGVSGFVAPKWEYFVGSFFHTSHGLFFFSPFLAIAALGAVVAFRSGGRFRVETAHALALIVFFTLYISSFTSWRSGWSVGPRYIANILPFMTALALIGLDALWSRWPAVSKMLLASLGVFSMSVVTPSAVLFPHIPDHLRNGFYEMIVPLVADGFVNENVLGLGSVASWLLFAVVFGGVVSYVLFGGAMGIWRRLVTGIVSLSLVALAHFAYARGLGVDPKVVEGNRQTARGLFVKPPIWR
jgi:hypothetical protein